MNTNKNNFRILKPEESKLLYLEMLDDLVEFLENNNLNYSLGYGTLLGAVRHKGFIPWDDDIDIIMPREDYNKLVNLYKDNDKYNLFEITKTKNYLFPMAKFTKMNTYIYPEWRKKKERFGQAIDIFPLDYYKKKMDESDFLKFQANTKYFNTLGSGFNKASLYKILKEIYKFFRYPGNVQKRMIKEIDKITSEYKNETEYFSNILWIFDQYDCSLTKENFENFIMLDFENKKYKCINNYDEYLKTIYGDYMQFPPEDKRVAHNVTVYIDDSKE